MKDETRLMAHKALDMKIDGKSYEEIANELGCSKQYVEALLHHRVTERKRKKFVESIYPGLEKWINESNKTITYLTKELGYSHIRIVKQKLIGTKIFNIKDIFKIIEISQKPFEYLFVYTELEVEEYDEAVRSRKE